MSRRLRGTSGPRAPQLGSPFSSVVSSDLKPQSASNSEARPVSNHQRVRPSTSMESDMSDAQKSGDGGGSASFHALTPSRGSILSPLSEDELVSQSRTENNNDIATSVDKKESDAEQDEVKCSTNRSLSLRFIGGGLLLFLLLFSVVFFILHTSLSHIDEDDTARFIATAQVLSNDVISSLQQTCTVVYGMAVASSTSLSLSSFNRLHTLTNASANKFFLKSAVVESIKMDDRSLYESRMRSEYSDTSLVILGKLFIDILII